MCVRMCVHVCVCGTESMLGLGLKYQYYIKKYRFTYLWQREHKTPEEFFLWPSEFLHSI